MKLICPAFFLLSIVLLTACGSPDKPSSAVDSASNDNASINNAISIIPPDPMFSLTTQVVSPYCPRNIVRDVAFDNNGVLWFTSWEGIMSYDGKEFTNHTQQSHLSHHRVYSVMKDSKGNMWFGTLGNGVYKFNGTTFTNLNSNNGLLNNRVFDLFEDASGNIWMATDSGAAMYDGKSFKNITPNDSLQGPVYAISQDQFGQMWFGTETGLFLYDGERAIEMMTEYNTHYSNVRDLCWNETMWIGASSGLYSGRRESKADGIVINRIDTKFTSYIHKLANGDLLLTSDGLFRYNTKYTPAYPATNHFTALIENRNNPGIFGAIEDAAGNIWYGAMDGLHKVTGSTDVSFAKQ